MLEREGCCQAGPGAQLWTIRKDHSWNTENVDILPAADCKEKRKYGGAYLENNKCFPDWNFKLCTGHITLFNLSQLIRRGNTEGNYKAIE